MLVAPGRTLLVAGALAFAALPGRAQEWKASEVVKPYSVSGATGIALYESIGAKGPSTSLGSRAIAHTTWDLKWSRKYEPQADGSCRLIAAKPFLTITYTLPRAGKLAEPTAGLWKTFVDGIAAHEKVHGKMIREMVDGIIATTIGLTVPADPKCQKIRKEIETPLIAARDAYRAKSRDFVKVEMSEGGNVHRLILGLVNGR